MNQAWRTCGTANDGTSLSWSPNPGPNVCAALLRRQMYNMMPVPDNNAFSRRFERRDMAIRGKAPCAASEARRQRCRARRVKAHAARRIYDSDLHECYRHGGGACKRLGGMSGRGGGAVGVGFCFFQDCFASFELTSRVVSCRVVDRDHVWIECCLCYVHKLPAMRLVVEGRDVLKSIGKNAFSSNSATSAQRMKSGSPLIL